MLSVTKYWTVSIDYDMKVILFSYKYVTCYNISIDDSKINIKIQ